MPNYLEYYFPESKYGGFSDVDSTVIFYNRINALIKPSDVILDVGCGRGKFFEDKISYRRQLRNFKGKVKKVIGIDIDPEGKKNPFLDSFYKIESEIAWPIEDDSINLLFSDQVLEHIKNPDQFFNECKRVLRKGGYLCIRTTNYWGYIALASRLIPEKYHQRLLRKIQPQRKELDIFPTFYYCNSKKAIESQLKRVNFKHYIYGHNAEPSYFNFNKWIYALIKGFHKICPDYFKTTLFIFAEKQ
jgi:SAM-dependent methyltransferase